MTGDCTAPGAKRFRIGRPARMDKRDLSSLFRERLKTLVRRSDLNQSAFAARGRHRPLGAVAAAVGRHDAAAACRDAAQHRLREQGLARLAAGAQPGRRADRRNPRQLRARGGKRRLRPHAAGALARRGGGHQDPLRSGRHSRPAAHRSADRIRGRHHQQEPRVAGRRDALPHRLFSAGRRPTWRSACRCHTLDIFARGLGVWSGVSGKRARRAARPHGAPARRSLPDLPPVPL